MNLTEIQNNIRDYLSSHRICAGLGSEESACTIAAINLSISGKLTDARPNCVCPVIHAWVIPIQDAMPDDMRNNGWTDLVPLIAGSYNPELEQKRKDLILDWIWTVVLPQLTPVAERYGFGKEWATMLELNTADAAAAAAADADAAAAGAAAAARAADAAAADGAAGARAAARTADAAYYAAAAARAADAAAARTADAAYWEAVNPTALLEKLLSVK